MGVERAELAAINEVIHAAEKTRDLKGLEKACRAKEYLLASGERPSEWDRASVDDRYVMIFVVGMAPLTFILVLYAHT